MRSCRPCLPKALKSAAAPTAAHGCAWSSAIWATGVARTASPGSWLRSACEPGRSGDSARRPLIASTATKSRATGLPKYGHPITPARIWQSEITYWIPLKAGLPRLHPRRLALPLRFAPLPRRHRQDHGLRIHRSLLQICPPRTRTLQPQLTNQSPARFFEEGPPREQTFTAPTARSLRRQTLQIRDYPGSPMHCRGRAMSRPRQR